MRRKLLTRLILIDIVLTAALLFLLLMERSGLIVAVGLRTANLLIAAGCVVLAAALLYVNIRLLLRLRALRPAGNIELSQGMPPEQIRRELAFFQEEKPKLKTQLMRGTAQLDSLARKQQRLAKIQARNQRVTFLGQVEETLQETGKTLCANLVRVLNRVDLWDTQDAGQAGEQERYRGHWMYIKQVLDRNDEILGVCDDLLLEAVHYVNGMKTGADNTAPLESMIQIIQRLSAESGIAQEGESGNVES